MCVGRKRVRICQRVDCGDEIFVCARRCAYKKTKRFSAREKRNEIKNISANVYLNKHFNKLLLCKMIAEL